MAARPIYRQMMAKLNQAGGMFWLLDQVKQARNLTKIAEELGVSRSFLSKECNRPTVKADYEIAKLEAAEVHLEKVIDIATDAQPVNAVTAKLQMEAHKWAAMVKDPRRYGNNNGTQLQVNVGQVMIDDLRKRNMDSVTITKQIEGETE